MTRMERALMDVAAILQAVAARRLIVTEDTSFKVGGRPMTIRQALDAADAALGGDDGGAPVMPRQGGPAGGGGRAMAPEGV